MRLSLLAAVLFAFQGAHAAELLTLSAENIHLVPIVP